MSERRPAAHQLSRVVARGGGSIRRASGRNRAPDRADVDAPSRIATLPRPPQVTGTLLAALARLLSGSSVRWIDCQPDTCQRVYFANHTSHLDAIVVWSALPHVLRSLVRPVAAKDYWEKGYVRRYLARTFNALLIDRTDIKVHQSPVDLMLREIGDRYSLIVFPEGSRAPTPRSANSRAGCIICPRNGPTWSWCPCTSTT